MSSAMAGQPQQGQPKPGELDQPRDQTPQQQEKAGSMMVLALLIGIVCGTTLSLVLDSTILKFDDLGNTTIS